MEHPYLMEDRCRRVDAERLAEARREALLGEARQSRHTAEPHLHKRLASLVLALVRGL